MEISYAITVCNEFVEVKRLLQLLLKKKRDKDEIVVLVDLTKNSATSELLGYLHKLSYNDLITLVEDRFNDNFAEWKNRLSRACKGDYIFQIDADELPNELLIENLPAILEENPDNEVYYVPRINTVEGLTQKHIETWGWNVNEEGWINWPDYQMRIWENKSEIVWRNKVHEVLQGYQTFSALPLIEEFSLYHPKDIKKQERQNAYYSTL
jgi:hypothetical protein